MSHTHEEKDCPCPYSEEPMYIARATWICTGCGRDVSLEYVLLCEAKKNQ